MYHMHHLQGLKGESLLDNRPLLSLTLNCDTMLVLCTYSPDEFDGSIVAGTSALPSIGMTPEPTSGEAWEEQQRVITASKARAPRDFVSTIFFKTQWFPSTACSHRCRAS